MSWVAQALLVFSLLQVLPPGLILWRCHFLLLTKWCPAEERAVCHVETRVNLQRFPSYSKYATLEANDNIMLSFGGSGITLLRKVNCLFKNKIHNGRIQRLWLNYKKKVKLKWIVILDHCQHWRKTLSEIYINASRSRCGCFYLLEHLQMLQSTVKIHQVVL